MFPSISAKVINFPIFSLFFVFVAYPYYDNDAFKHHD